MVVHAHSSGSAVTQTNRRRTINEALPTMALQGLLPKRWMLAQTYNTRR